MFLSVRSEGPLSLEKWQYAMVSLKAPLFSGSKIETFVEEVCITLGHKLKVLLGYTQRIEHIQGLSFA